MKSHDKFACLPLQKKQKKEMEKNSNNCEI